MELFGFTLDPEGFQSLIGAALGTGAAIGTLFTLLTLFYGRTRS